MYEFNLVIGLFEQALEKVREALMSEHPGIVGKVDAQSILSHPRRLQPGTR